MCAGCWHVGPSGNSDANTLRLDLPRLISLWEWSLWSLWGSVCIICLCLFTFVLMRLFAFLCVLNPWWAFNRQNLSQCAFVSISFSFAKKVAGVFLLGFSLIIFSIALPFIRYAVYSALFWGQSVFLQSAYQQLIHVIIDGKGVRGSSLWWALWPLDNQINLERRCREVNPMCKGFESLHAENNGLAVHHLHHSATSSSFSPSHKS